MSPRNRLLSAAVVVAACLGAGDEIAAQGDEARTDPASQPAELGAVAWYRDEVTAREAAQRTGRPLLVQFQEVPG